MSYHPDEALLAGQATDRRVDRLASTVMLMAVGVVVAVLGAFGTIMGAGAPADAATTRRLEAIEKEAPRYCFACEGHGEYDLVERRILDGAFCTVTKPVRCASCEGTGISKAAVCARRREVQGSGWSPAVTFATNGTVIGHPGARPR